MKLFKPILVAAGCLAVAFVLMLDTHDHRTIRTALEKRIDTTSDSLSSLFENARSSIGNLVETAFSNPNVASPPSPESDDAPTPQEAAPAPRPTSSLDWGLTRRLMDMGDAVVLGGILALACLSAFMGMQYRKREQAVPPMLLKAIKRIGEFQGNVDIPQGHDGEAGPIADSLESMLADLRQNAVSRNYLRLIVQNLNDPIVEVSPEHRIRQVNNMAQRILGYPSQEILGTEMRKLFGLSENEFARLLNYLLERECGAVIDVDLQRPFMPPVPIRLKALTSKSFTDVEGIFFLLAPRADEDGDGQARPLHEQPPKPLTHADFMDCLYRSLASDALEAGLTACIRLRGFTSQNEQQALRNAIRGQDDLADLEDGTFAVLLRGIQSVDTARTAASRLLELHKPDTSDDAVPRAAGISVSRPAEISPAGLLANAQLALDIAQHRARRWVVYDSTLSATAWTTALDDDELRHAVLEGEFLISYQPIFNLEDGTLVALEAFPRWYHPDLGVTPPAAFLPRTKQLGLSIALGRFMLERSARDFLAWRAHAADFQGMVALNVSEEQLLDGNLLEDVREVLDSTDSSMRFMFEFPAQLARLHPHDVEKTARLLRKIGMKTALDLNSKEQEDLSELPGKTAAFDVLKIDVSTGGMTLASGRQLICAAKCVENKAQYHAARKAGLQWAQGYHFGPLLPPEKVVRHVLGNVG
jgi:EAL domain-containing protein (putative c-di-GMP-specific phosphodiesterase class I)/PAS domain-containing protein